MRFTKKDLTVNRSPAAFESQKADCSQSDLTEIRACICNPEWNVVEARLMQREREFLERPECCVGYGREMGFSLRVPIGWLIQRSYWPVSSSLIGQNYTMGTYTLS